MLKKKKKKKNIVISTHLPFAIIFRLDMPVNSPCYMCKLQNFENLLAIAPGKVQVGKDQEKAQSEKDSHSKNRGGKKPN